MIIVEKEKREWLAVKFMCALLSNSDINNMSNIEFAKEAYNVADAFMEVTKQVNKENE